MSIRGTPEDTTTAAINECCFLREVRISGRHLGDMV
jgi:hypothetical protein